MPRRCGLGCTPTRGKLHVFPNPDKFPEQFKAWVQVVSGQDECNFNYKIMRICDRHFTGKDRNRYNRLNALAVPSLFLRGEQPSNPCGLSNSTLEQTFIQPEVSDKYHQSSSGPLHLFPNPNTGSCEVLEKFNIWKSILSSSIQEKGNNYIYNSIRLCNSHFIDGYCLPSHRLTKNAIPTLCLEPQDQPLEELVAHTEELGPDTTLHKFPDPEKELDRYNRWISAIGGNVLVIDPKSVFKNGRVCHSHFNPKFNTTSKRLSKNAVPSLFLSGKLHRFPSQEYPYAEKFDQWKMVLSEIDRERGDNYIYNNMRICDHHFEEFYRTASGRLTKNAVPTLNIGKIDEKATEKSSLDIPEVSDIQQSTSEHRKTPILVPDNTSTTITPTPGDLLKQPLTSAADINESTSVNQRYQLSTSSANIALPYKSSHKSDQSDREKTITLIVQSKPSNQVEDGSSTSSAEVTHNIGCGNNSNNKKKDPNSVISFHAFPSNRELKTKWLRAIGRPNWMPPTYSRVCSAHFNSEQINYDGSRIRVKDEACPVNSLPPNSNFEASYVQACRVCLATDIKMYSLQNTYLGACMETVAGFNQNCNIDGMPQYICYQCAPCLIKCNKLIEKCMISQATLLDIFAKNGQITKDLIKEQSRAELNLEAPLNDSSLLNDSLFKYDDIDNISHHIISKSDSDEINNDNEHYEDDTKTETDMEDIQNEKCEKEANDNEMREINNVINNNDDVHEVQEVPDEDLKEKINSIVETQEKEVVQIKRIKKRLVRSKANSLTQVEQSMLKYFNIVKLSLYEQFEEWEKSIRRRRLVNETVYPCEICGKLFANVNSHRAHVTNHDPSLGRVECAVCKLRFKSPALANYHARRAHSKKFCCKMCPKTFNNLSTAKRHQRWHLGYLYKCDECTFSTLHEASLSVHKRSAHGGVHACAACGRTYVSARGLHVHTQYVHRMNKETDVSSEHRCEDCDISFASEGARRVHILTSSQHRTKIDSCNATAQENIRNCCKKCGVECSTFKDLVLHSRAEHPRSRRSRQQCRGDTVYPMCCELCGETISSRKKHWNHVRQQHPKDIDTYQPVITAVCDICGKGFQNKSKLYLHQLRHRSPTVHCPSCPQLFYDKYALARHARLHDDLRPHQCRTCGRAFKRLNNLERHSRVHTNIFPYECTMCGKKYKYSSSINLHVRTVHYKLPHPSRKKRSKSAKDGSHL